MGGYSICPFYAILPLNIHYTPQISVIKTDVDQKNIFCQRVDIEQNKFISKRILAKQELMAASDLLSYQSTEHFNSKSQYEKRQYVVPTKRSYISAIFKGHLNL